MQGNTYKGVFANNLWAISDNKEKHYLNPFDTKEQHAKYIEYSRNSVKFNK